MVHWVVAFRRNGYGPSKPVRILFQGSDSVGTTDSATKDCALSLLRSTYEQMLFMHGCES